MKRRIVFKYINQQLTADQSVDFNACPLYFPKRNIALNHHQRSCFYLGHLKGSLYNLVDCSFGKLLIFLSVIKKKQF